MSGSVNKVTLVGNLRKDPEIRHANDWSAIANLPVGTSDEWEDKATGEYRARSEWHRIVILRRLAKIAQQYFTKSSKGYC